MTEPVAIYHYHRETGQFLFAATARPDPLETGRWLVPAGATLLPPPEAGAGEAACFIVELDDWQIVPDRRGRVYYDTATGERLVIQQVNQEPDPTWTEQAPPNADHVWGNDGWRPSPEKLLPQVKTEAETRILALLPEWKQRNATARAVEIVNARLDNQASAVELAELAVIQTIFAQVKAIRVASDLIEANVTAGLVTSAAQIKSSGHWPVEG